MSDQIAQIPKDSHRFIFHMRLMVKTFYISHFHLNEKQFLNIIDII